VRRLGLNTWRIADIEAILEGRFKEDLFRDVTRESGMRGSGGVLRSSWRARWECIGSSSDEWSFVVGVLRGGYR
jgi:hypothetical protein